ncbi:hypothetical protein VIBNIAM115_840002 [Vibrio nigripulchritudo AM115]|nr:hypothetical protein VIBNIAM115_840002 [Vibrio nigripulchritudo AM115]
MNGSKTYREITVSQYLKEFLPDTTYTPNSIRIWLKKGILKGRQLPTGRWLIQVPCDPPLSSSDERVNELLDFMRH